MIVLLISCAPKAVPPPESAPEPIPLTPIALNGRIDDGVYHDASLRFAVRVPDGWTASPGPVPSPLRVTLTNVDLGLRFEIWSYPGADSDLRPREGCLWTFDDVGEYRLVDQSESLRVATCTPDDPEDPRVLATVVVRNDVSYHLEASIPERSFVAGKEAVLGVVSGIEWR